MVVMTLKYGAEPRKVQSFQFVRLQTIAKSSRYDREKLHNPNGKRKLDR